MFRNVEEKFLSGERAKEVTKERAGKVRLINAIIGDGVANTSAAVAVRKAAYNYCNTGYGWSIYSDQKNDLILTNGHYGSIWVNMGHYIVTSIVTLDFGHYIVTHSDP